ncbi:hypothetical protein [Entomohabitans teleogrylli]|uniref:hypothetical protein n=1 Tax=Entomohabitans teleogrylli TaxID=1384589 RepID=UPI00073DAAC3|nr:hypothetical protein [Entomohabitans teleogrylli]
MSVWRYSPPRRVFRKRGAAPPGAFCGVPALAETIFSCGRIAAREADRAACRIRGGPDCPGRQ